MGFSTNIGLKIIIIIIISVYIMQTKLLSVRMVEMKKFVRYLLVYLLVILALILPVVMVIVERVFSTMNIIKNRLRKRIGD